MSQNSRSLPEFLCVLCVFARNFPKNVARKDAKEFGEAEMVQQRQMIR
jgi:hypothetical protein